ncbi:bifunctional adenosylcobinamide kinase/adenosylcobinamide-phosphate guanylyltransferase [Catenovulum adriaticum]|uniref:Bifunctional adenosylcobalamin biosynthesis protein n=1 Tax=Catenovulum adriaticum TaxID=2984846 RepID=A0ABY7AH54_9ALTE|nr:bifunctional adenosylcobinamide kinase/adenosylcobinamide-phosphate guanylyltransferase [Catenovulum sp. TS8]WAJ68962.1 bifunctional adenosylcobinamide kinase/adenosylcobinamide-phosphate guanylyltransferase [Catenovulum sp. TS8]
MIYFIIGGARSGKSRYGENLAKSLANNHKSSVLNIATAQPSDEEMKARIKQHQIDRPSDWQLAEVPFELSEYLLKLEAQIKKAEINQKPFPNVILIDCLTLWLNNHLFLASHLTEQAIQKCEPELTPKPNFYELFEQLKSALLSLSCDVILIANEVGLGVVPMGEISRQFVDEAGRLNQSMARIADQAVLMTAGLPLILKGGHHDHPN